MLFFASQGFAKTKMYGRTVLTGGTDSVDNIPYADLNDGDLCIVITSSKVLYFYRFESTSAAAESSPLIIEPDDQTGNGRWEITPDIPTANTIGGAYIYRAGGTDVPDADVADDITAGEFSGDDITVTDGTDPHLIKAIQEAGGDGLIKSLLVRIIFCVILQCIVLIIHSRSLLYFPPIYCFMIFFHDQICAYIRQNYK